MAQRQLNEEEIATLSRQSKTNLLNLIVALTSENPEAMAFLNSQEQRKANGRRIAIQDLLRENKRLKSDLTKTVFEKGDLITRVPEEKKPEWLKEAETRKQQAKQKGLDRAVKDALEKGDASKAAQLRSLLP